MRENEEQTYTCSECGAVVNEGNMYTFDEHVLCDVCLERLTVTCDNCGRRIWRTDAECDSYIALCSHCYEYIQKENSAARFFECCVYQSGYDNNFVASSLLYNSYLNYCKQNGLSYIGKAQFYKLEKVLMLDHSRTAKERGYKGVRLVNRKFDI